MIAAPARDPPTIYRATAWSRTVDALSAVVIGGFGVLLLLTAATVGRQLSWPEWLFSSLVTVPIFLFAAQAASRSRIAERIEVTSAGFVTYGVRSEARVDWKDVTGARYFSFYGDRFVDVMLAPGAVRRKIRVNLAGLDPDGREFLLQLYHFAPTTLEPRMAKMLQRLGLGRRQKAPRPDPSTQTPRGMR